MKLGRVTTLNPFQVQINGDTSSTVAVKMSDFTGATANAATGTEVLVDIVEGRRYAFRVL